MVREVDQLVVRHEVDVWTSQLGLQEEIVVGIFGNNRRASLQISEDSRDFRDSSIFVTFDVETYFRSREKLMSVRTKGTFGQHRVVPETAEFVYDSTSPLDPDAAELYHINLFLSFVDERTRRSTTDPFWKSTNIVFPEKVDVGVGVVEPDSINERDII